MSGPIIDLDNITDGRKPQKEIEIQRSTPLRKVVIVGFDMPFMEIVMLMVKFAIASIPAAIILAGITAFLTMFLSMMGHSKY